jgi:ABC-type uncharacterized transport system substrate-binding protein
VWVFKRLSFGFALTALTSSVLLISDWNRRQPGTRRVPHVAILQHASQPIIDEGVRGMLDGLAESGFTDGRSVTVRRYNAEGDIGTANAIAKEITSGQYDLVLTATTLSLQAVANANKAGKTVQVFGLVSDPFGAGVGIRRDNPLDHPRHLVGIGTMQPVAEAFRLAKKLFPGLTTVGEAWNPAEANSEAQTRIARKITAELGITLLEANVDNSAGVFEAESSLVSRGAQALWVGGDIAVSTAFESVMSAARKGGIPVFTSLPGNAQRGALFDLGANYHEVGKITGALAGRILNGTDPATLPVEEAVPPRLLVNTQALKQVKDPWRLPDDVLREATAVIDENGLREKAVAATPPPVGRVFKVGVAYFAPDPGQESCLQGLRDGLRDQGFVEGQNLELRKSHAQGEIANIPAMLQNFDTLGLDLIVPMTTPCLTGACSVVKKTPVVFTYVYDPIAAGAGKTPTDHLPNITGVGSFPPVAETIDVIQQLVPGVRSVGTLYNSSEANSRKVVGVARELFRQRGITLEEVAITSSSEVFQAAQVLSHRNVQALWVTGDNTALQAFAGIAKVAADARLPLINNDPEFVQQGALVSVGIGWYQTGYAAAKAVARVLRGESPQAIPFENIAVKQLELNHAVARTLGITFPPELIKAAANAQPPASPQPQASAPLAKKWRISLVELTNTPNVEDSQAGVLAGLREAGLVEGRDYEIKIRNAQGDMPTLNTIVDAALTEGADLIYTITTPALQTAMQKVRDRPLLFCLTLNPVMLGGGQSNDRHLPNVTGVFSRDPFEDMLALLRESFPAVRRIGTLFVPSEPNSVYFKDELTKTAATAGVEVVTVPVSTTGEVPDAVLALASRHLDAICQIADNLTGSTFASIAQAARRARIPLFGFSSGQARLGAAVVVARDYFEGGKESALLAARVMRGENPGAIPFSPTKKIKLVINPTAASAYGLTLPPALLKRADVVIGREQ